MRTFEQLNEEEQQQAEEVALQELLTAVVDGGLRFSDELNEDDLQARIDASWTKADALQTPWFIAEILLEDEYVSQSLRGMARADAEDALYPDPHERVIELPLKVEVTNGQ